MILSEMDLVEFFLKHKKIALYGAGGMGSSLYSFMKMNGWEGKLAFFVVTQKQEELFCGFPVKEVHSLGGEELAVPVLIAVRQQHHESIRRELALAGAGSVYAVDDDLLTKIEKAKDLLEQEHQEEKMTLPALQMRQMTESMSLLYQKMEQIQKMLGDINREKK